MNPRLMNRDDVLQRLRLAKHRAFVGLRPLRMKYYDVTEPITQAWHTRFPYRYDAGDFASLEFMAHDEPARHPTTEPVPRRIVTFWNGDNEMSADRKAGLESLRRVNPGVEVLVITPENRGEWILPEAPLHPAFGLLHHVHQADYLRCYFLHFHGGGYADIKTFRQAWLPAFEAMDDSDAWLMGYVNPRRWMTPNFADADLQRLMWRTSVQRLGQAAYISRPRTPLSAEWWRELNAVIDDATSELQAHPGGDPAYPLHWNRLLAQIVDPLTLKHRAHVFTHRDLLYATGVAYH